MINILKMVYKSRVLSTVCYGFTTPMTCRALAHIYSCSLPWWFSDDLKNFVIDCKLKNIYSVLLQSAASCHNNNLTFIDYNENCQKCKNLLKTLPGSLKNFAISRNYISVFIQTEFYCVHFTL